MPLKIKKLDPFVHVKPFETTTQADYGPKPLSYNANDKWRNRFRKEGLIPELLFDYEQYKYVDNFTTINDLKYNWFPKCLAKRRKQPQDLLVSFGNLTKFGLKEQKHYNWSQDRQDPRTTLESEYKNVFLKHDLEPYSPKCKKLPSCNIISWKCDKDFEKKKPPCIPEHIKHIDYRLKYIPEQTL